MQSRAAAMTAPGPFAGPAPAAPSREAPSSEARRSREATPGLANVRRGEIGSEVRPRRLERREEWTWESWGQRSERSLIRAARNLEMLNWAGIGALLGAAAAAAPAFYFGFGQYPFVFAQPLGAAAGAILGNLVVHWRWSADPHLSDRF
ncbi:MAG: hypothetical protein HY686_05305 [Chloroflexi bacterium]|nr:hypothetical protein [Chloroflexota bacterium]